MSECEGVPLGGNNSMCAPIHSMLFLHSSRYRWLQHTSFLWDYDGHKLNRYLTNPAKQPQYRNQRFHEDFLCKLKDRTKAGDPEEVIDHVCRVMATHYGAQLVDASLDQANELLHAAEHNSELTSSVVQLLPP